MEGGGNLFQANSHSGRRLPESGTLWGQERRCPQVAAQLEDLRERLPALPLFSSPGSVVHRRGAWVMGAARPFPGAVRPSLRSTLPPPRPPRPPPFSESPFPPNPPVSPASPNDRHLSLRHPSGPPTPTCINLPTPAPTPTTVPPPPSNPLTPNQRLSHRGTPPPGSTEGACMLDCRQYHDIPRRHPLDFCVWFVSGLRARVCCIGAREIAI